MRLERRIDDEYLKQPRELQSDMMHRLSIAFEAAKQPQQPGHVEC